MMAKSVSIVVTVTNTVASSRYDDSTEKIKVGALKLQTTCEGRWIGRELCKAIRFIDMAGGVPAEDIVSVVNEEFSSQSPEYLSAAERAANAAVVTLSHGFDERLDTLRRVVNRLCEKVEG